MDFYRLFANAASSIFGSSSQDVQRQAQIQQELDNQRLRNEARIAQIKVEMGTKYILHPSHMKSKLDEPRPV